MDYLSNIDLTKSPEHVAIIMDGNGRWAKKQGHLRLFGHNSGVESIRETLKGARELKIKYLTLYAFSTENWSRPKEEVDGLMDLLVTSLVNEVPELSKSGVRIMTIGNISEMPESCQKQIAQAKEDTKDNTEINLILALNYSARSELKDAMRTISQKVQNDTLKLEEITNELISEHLTTKGIPDPDLLIRTSGEHRISNFLLWQIAYSELYFTDVLWPDFKKEDLYKAVLEYQSRERRFGMTSEQLT